MKNKRCIFFLFLLCSLFFPSVFGISIDEEVTSLLEEQGYAEVIIFVAEPLSPETASLLQTPATLPGQEKKQLHQLLQEKKKVIQKQQQRALAQMNIEDEAIIEEGIDAAALQRENVDIILEEKYTYVNAFTGIITQEGYDKLVQNNAVIAIALNEEVELMLDDAIPFVHADFAANLSVNWSTVDGEGVGICVIDTGIDTTHPDLQNVVVDQYCYCSQGTGCCPNSGKEDTSAQDDHGHGTAVVGTIASQDDTNSGIAPGADIVMIKAFSSSGSASTTDILSGINKCLELAEKRNIKIFSFSFGGKEYTKACDSDALASTANSLVDAGFFVAAASGNNGQSKKISTPACGSDVTAVGAVYDGSSSTPDTPASFSNSNEMLDIVAPGVDICTTKAGIASGSTCYTSPASGSYYSISGTSFSTPLVAGAAALVADYEHKETEIYPTSTAIKDALTLYGETILDARNGLQFPRLDIENTLKHIDSSAPTIAFAESVPENGEYIVPGEFLLSATITDTVNDVVLCTLSFNGTNSTMNLSAQGKTVTCTDSLFVTENTVFQIFATDANGNIGSSDSRMIRTQNAAPVIEGYTPSLPSLSLQIPENQTFTLNASDTDNDSLSYYWLVDGNQTGTTMNYTFVSSSPGNVTVLGIVGDGIVNSSINWTINVTQTTAPTTAHVTIIPSSPYRNDTLNCTYLYTDPENDPENGTIITWYRNETLQENSSETIIPSSLLFVDDTWRCAVTPSDGTSAGSTIAGDSVTIQNHVPVMSVNGNVTVNESDTVILLITVSDEDNDTLVTSLNDTRFISMGGGYYYNTTTNSSEMFRVLVSSTDGYDVTEQTILITIHNAVDSDLDETPDFKDTDDDNDNILDEEDNILGQLTAIGFPDMNVFINGTEEENATYTDNSFVSLSYNNETAVSFFYNFTESDLDLASVIIANESTNGNIFIRGLENVTNKTVYVDNTNSSADAVCILDTSDATLVLMSSTCTDTNEFLLLCNGVSDNGYTCTSVGEKYMITGLMHSGLIQYCTTCSQEEQEEEETTPEESVEVPVEETEESAAAGGGGGGAGPSTTTDEATTEQTSTPEETTGSEAVTEVNALVPTQNNEEVSEVDVATIQATPYTPSLFSLASITGGAVADLQQGKLTLASIMFLGIALALTIGLFIIGGFAARHAHTARTVLKKIDIREDIFNIYEGFKELFKK